MAPRSILSAILAAAAALLLCVPAQAQLRATAVRTIGDTPAHGEASEAAAVAQDGGGFLVAWGIEGGVQLRTLDAAGAPSGAIRTIALASKYVSASESVLLADALVLNEYDSSSGYRRTTLRRLDANGAVVGAPVPVFGTGVRGVAAVRQPGGGLLLAGVGDGSPRPVYARSLAADGTLGVQRQVATAGTEAPQPRASLAPGPAGGALLAFHDTQAIKLVRLSLHGAALGAPATLPGETGRWPDIAAGQGEYLVTWEQPGAFLIPGAVRAQRLDVAGAPAGAAFDVSARGVMGDDGAGPSVVAAADGWVIARRETGTVYSTNGAGHMLGRLLPYAAPESGAPEVDLTTRYHAYGVPSPAAGASATLLAWRPATSGPGPFVRLVGAGLDPGAAVLDAAPGGAVATRTAELRFHSTRPDAHLECSVDDGDWQPCTSPLLLSGLTDRVHSAAVRSVAADGWVELAPTAAARWRTEAAPPDTTITEPPDVTEAQPGISFAADEAALFDCRLDGGAWAPCSPESWVVPTLADGFSLRGVPDGPHVFEARAIDESGRVEPEPVRWAFTLDRRAPATRIQAGPITAAEWERPVFQFSSDEAGVHYECKRADGTYAEWRACRSGEPVTGLFRSVQVRAIDAVGNVDDNPAEWGNGTYGPDTSVAVAEDLDRAVVSIAPVDEAVPECSLDGEPFWRCPDSFVEWDLAQGQHELRLRTVRFDGVVSQAIPRTFTIARSVVPYATLIGQPPARTTSRSARIAWARSTASGSFVCAVDSGAAQPCTNPLQLDGMAVGTHRVLISGRGPAGQTDFYSARVDWEVMVAGEAPVPDRVSRAAAAAAPAPPRATITPLTRPWISARDVELTFTADQPGSTFECMVNRAEWSPCASPLRLTDLAEADYEVQVRATNAGQTGTADSEVFYVDRTAPDTQISSPMLVDGMPTSLPFARFVIEHRQLGTAEGHAWINDPIWVRCVLDGVLVGVCDDDDGIVRFDGLADGTHVLQAYAVDSAGNTDPTPAAFTWVVGAPAVDTRIVSGPPATTGSRVADFTLASAGADGFQCRIDGGSWEACPGAVRFDELADGSHRLEARAHAYNRVDDSPAVWTVDAAPRVTIADGPIPRSGDAAPAFTVLVDDPAARRECRLDDGAWGPCPATVNVGDGSHVLEARAIDAGDRVGVAEPWRWTTDLSAPNTTVLDAPPPVNALGKIVLTFTGTATTERFECRLDGGEWQDCSRGAWLIQRVETGAHVAVVRALNASGTPDPTPAVVRWTGEGEQPSIALTQRSPEPTKRSTATFDVASDDPTARVECRLSERGGWEPCRGNYTVSGLQPGSHALTARAIDAAGNTSWIEESWRQVEDTPEETEIISGPQITPNYVHFTVGLTGPTLGCRLDGGEWRTCTGGDVWCCTPTPAGTHTVEFASIGPDGDRDATPATRTWTIAGPTPTPTPTVSPTATPTASPTATPTASPTATPTASPTATPTASPTATPTVSPTATPTVSPTATPTASPTPTATPTASPTTTPTASPTTTPTASPTTTPTASPTTTPTASPTPTAVPTAAPTASPTVTATPEPTAAPTALPLAAPTPAATPTPNVTPTPAPFARAARDRVAAVIARSSRPTAKVALTAPAPGRLEVRLLDARGRTVTRRTVTYAAAGTRSITLRPGKARSVSVRWVPKRGAREDARRTLRRR